jgi:hypothetical protein
MGLLDAITGRVSEIKPEKARDDLGPILVEEELISAAFVIYRDLMVFTNLRLILVDKQGMIGSKVSYESVPYDSVERFEVENAGTFDADAELTLWIKGRSEPFYQELSLKVDPTKVSRILARHILT